MNKDEIIDQLRYSTQGSTRKLLKLVWNAAIDAAAESAEVNVIGYNDYEVDKESITSLKFKTDEK